MDDLIFIDESGCHPGIGPRRGWSPKGEPLHGPEQAYARKQHISIIAAISTDGVIAQATHLGGIGSDKFCLFIENKLVPVLRPGHIVCMDNLRAHKSKRVKELIEATGAQIIYLPPYSPDLNPIEAAWAKVKKLIRKYAPKTVQQLRRAIYRALDKLTASDAQGYYRYCGYNAEAQLQ